MKELGAIPEIEFLCVLDTNGGIASNPSQWMRTHGNEHWEFDYYGLQNSKQLATAYN
jgi:nuclear transport factor 2 (NTF2) superfamily protein